MHCRSQPWHRSTELTAAHRPRDPETRDPETRVGDGERQAVAELLGDAAAAGYLSLDELDERLSTTWRATTGAELALAEAGLPTELRRDRARRQATAQARRAARAGLVPHLVAYLSVMLLLVTVWLVVGLAGNGWYPWPLWPALGWGIGIAQHVRHATATPAA
jgi:hypothetical protein